MIAVDADILVYAHRRDSGFHPTATEAIRELAESVPWSIPWPCIHEFCAVVTHPRIYDPPTDTDAGADQVDAWLEAPTRVMLAETMAHWSHLRGLLTNRRIAGAQVQDAHRGDLHRPRCQRATDSGQGLLAIGSPTWPPRTLCCPPEVPVDMRERWLPWPGRCGTRVGVMWGSSARGGT